MLTTCEEGSLVFLLLFYPLKSSVAENRSIVEFTLIEVVGVFAPIKKIVVAHNHSSYLYKKKQLPINIVVAPMKKIVAAHNHSSYLYEKNSSCP